GRLPRSRAVPRRARHRRGRPGIRSLDRPVEWVANCNPRPLGSPVMERGCSIARTVEVIGDRWTMLILRDSFRGVRRFDDIQRDQTFVCWTCDRTITPLEIRSDKARTVS